MQLQSNVLDTILKCLKNGKTLNEIEEEYGINALEYIEAICKITGGLLEFINFVESIKNINGKERELLIKKSIFPDEQKSVGSDKKEPSTGFDEKANNTLGAYSLAGSIYSQDSKTLQLVTEDLQTHSPNGQIAKTDGKQVKDIRENKAEDIQMAPLEESAISNNSKIDIPGKTETIINPWIDAKTVSPGEMSRVEDNYKNRVLE